MMDWLRNLLMIFYAPVRGMRGMRDRGSLAPVVLIAFLGQLAFSVTTKKFAGTPTIASGGSTYAELFAAARFVVVVAVVLVPILTFVANLFERRGSFRVVITQEYASVAATILYGLGVEIDKELPGPQGRPMPVIDRGIEAVKELF